MPIPNDQFNPGVISNSFEVRQLTEWLAGRPVPTIAELTATVEVERPIAVRPRAVVRVSNPPAPVVQTPAPPPKPTKTVSVPAAPAPASSLKRPIIRTPLKICPRPRR